MMSTLRRFRRQPFILSLILFVTASSPLEAKERARVAAGPNVDVVSATPLSSEGTPSQRCEPASAEGVTATSCNGAAITINDNSTASPYPSNIVVSGEPGVVSSVTVTLTGVNHTFPEDINILLVSPSGRKMLLMANAGGSNALTNATLTFSDAAAGYLPDAGAIPSGTFRPSSYADNDNPSTAIASFSAPAPSTSPSSPYAATLSAFKGDTPNGTWSLYVRDVFTGDAGTITDGWCLNITTAPSVPRCPATLFTGSLATGDLTQTGRITRNGISSLCTAAKAYPGTNDTQVGRRYDLYAIVNQSSTSQCVTASLSSACGTLNDFLVAYSGSYNPANVQTNYLADNGNSYAAQSGLMSFTMAPGATVLLIVHEITASAGCTSYGLLIEGNICSSTLAVDPALATTLALYAANPNPFADHTAIAFTLPSRSSVKLAITDIAGRHIATLWNETLDAGLHSVGWAGLDDDGHHVPRGVYLVNLRTEQGARAMKMVLCR